ncbi:CDP-alcohol phosphatidyltransferase family protein [Patescibacteria group bacterium]|nr:CDP-alcohol phosphatidyltransferase family protein [Patescibacteria group bacterium]
MTFFIVLLKKYKIFFDKIKIYKDKFINPVIKLLPSWVSPNSITIFRMFLVFFAFILYFIFKFSAFYLFFIFALNWLLDLLDGSLARKQNKATSLGSILDKLSDRFLWSLIYIAIYYLTLYKLVIFLFCLEILFLLIFSLALLFNFSEEKCYRLNGLKWYISMIWLVVIIIDLAI